MGTNGYTERIVISLGGSLVVPKGGIDVEFLKKLNEFIRSQLATHPERQFFLVVGGGATARKYRDAGENVIGHALTPEDLDWLGIHSTRLNSQLIRTIFRDVAHPYVIKNYDIIRKVSEPVAIAAGWKPGWSTDFDAVLLCEDYNVQTIINLSNIDTVYDRDPKEFPDAKPLKKITWDEFRKLVGDEWVPGMNAPFDPIAAKKAQVKNVKVFVVNGNDFGNVTNVLEKKPFLGTVIG